MKAYVSMASLICVEQRDYKQSFDYLKTVYLVRLRLFPADSKEIREVESMVFEYALLLLLAYARAGEQSSVVKKVVAWSIDAAQRGLADCGKKPAAQRAAQADNRELPDVSFERSLRGESRTKELQVFWRVEKHVPHNCFNLISALGTCEDSRALLAPHLPPAPPRHSVSAA